MNIIDLFCGTGGFSKGIRSASDDFSIAGGLDTKQKAVQTFNHNHDGDAIAADIRELHPKSFLSQIGVSKEDVDIVVGGPPCQGFSTLQANSDEDGEDERNSLYLEFLDYIEHCNPDVVVMENVPKIALDYRPIVDDCVQKLQDQGYTVEWRILNSVFYGVPQTRTRFILIASSIGDPQFPEPTHYSETQRTRGEADIDNYVEPETPSNLEPAVTTMDAIGDLPFLQVSCDCTSGSSCDCRGRSAETYETSPLNDYQEQMRDDDEVLEDHRAPNHSDRMVQMIQHVPEGKGMKAIPEEIRPSSGYTSSYGRLPGQEPSNTLTSAFTSLSSNKCAHPRQNRALTIREGARIQSFPDSFTFPIRSKSEKARQIGNAVPPLLGQKIGEQVHELTN